MYNLEPREYRLIHRCQKSVTSQQVYHPIETSPLQSGERALTHASLHNIPVKSCCTADASFEGRTRRSHLVFNRLAPMRTPTCSPTSNPIAKYHSSHQKEKKIQESITADLFYATQSQLFIMNLRKTMRTFGHLPCISQDCKSILLAADYLFQLLVRYQQEHGTQHG